MAPTTFGRVIALTCGISLGLYLSLELFSDYELIKKEERPAEYDENGRLIKKPFKVSFRNTEPLKLKPEALERLRKQEQELKDRERESQGK